MNRLTKAACVVVLALLGLATPVPAQVENNHQAEILLEEAQHRALVDGDLERAIKLCQQIIAEHNSNRAVAAKALLQMGGCYEKLGNTEAQKAYGRIVEEYADQSATMAQARTRLAALISSVDNDKPLQPKFNIRKVLGNTKIEPLGTPSPDGRYISFVDWRANSNLSIIELETNEKRCVTDFKKEGDQAYYSQWSPDGNKLAYFWWEMGDTDKYNISVVDADGSNSKDLFKSEQVNWIELGNWSNDGNYLIATLSLRNKRQSQIVQISSEDGSMQILRTINNPYLGGKPLFSPDSRYVAYDLPDDKASGNSDIHIYSIEDKSENALFKHPAHDYILGWTPDGEHILFASDRTGTVDAMIVPVHEGKATDSPRTVKSNIGSIIPMGFTHDGKFYYGDWPGQSNVFSAVIDIENGKTIKKPTLLINRFEGRNGAPSYSHNGKYLAYISKRGVVNKGKSETVLCIKDLETGVEDVVFPPHDIATSISYPTWSPDDNNIALVCKKDKRSIYQFNIPERKFTPLVTEAVNQPYYTDNTYPQWSADAKTLYYLQISEDSDVSRILARNLNTGKDKELYRYQSDDFMDRIFNISISPDRKWISAINRGEKRFINLISTDDGQLKHLYSFDFKGGSSFPQVWSKDGKYIVYPYITKESGWDLMRIPVEGGEKMKIELGVWRISSPSLHPDGKTLVFSSVGYSFPKNNIWLMENFLPEEPVAKPEPTPTLRQVWAGPESPWQGKISPDGRYFSFVDGRDLAILELATGNIQRLTDIGDDSKKEYVFLSRWSPDSKQIVYEYNGDLSEMRIVGLDGSEPRILYREEEGGYVRPHDWSPDGRQVLAFLGREEINQIVLISVDDGAMHVIKTVTHGEHPYQWSFSPDGRHIVYESPQAEDSPESNIFLFSIDDKSEVPVVEHFANDKILGWVPDSDRLLFVSNRTGKWDAWAISIAQGKPKGDPELIKKSIGNIYPMGFSRNGAFYYTDSKQMKDIYTVTINPETGKIESSPNTLPVLRLGGNENPQYSPDGKYMAYVRGHNLCILSLETSNVRKFPPKFNARNVRWSPDSKYILFNSFDSIRPQRIYRLEVQTGNIIPILPPEEGYNVDYEYLISFNEWSHDGKSFFYVETDRKNKLSRILNRDFETGNEKELYRGPEYFSISLSPDGQWLAFAGRKVETEINVMPASGGESRELCKIIQPANSPTPLTWTADGRYVLFSTVQADTWLSNLWRVPKEGGEPQNLGLEMAEIYNITVHPDGRQIAFYSGGPSSEESEVWVMENFLPKTENAK
ncbi:hypothetical protein ACFL6U_23850 [Planctomycetota bacterium]